jgi:hypothetical protein
MPPSAPWTNPWTRPQRRACAAFMALAAFFVGASAFILALQPISPGAAPVPPAVPILVALAALFFLILAYASLRGRLWAYWLDLILLGFQLLGVLGALAQLLDPTLAAGDAATLASLDPTLDTVLHLIVSLLGFAIFLWLLPGLISRGNVHR